MASSEIDTSIRMLVDSDGNRVRRKCVDLLEDQVALLDDHPARNGHDITRRRLVS